MTKTPAEVEKMAASGALLASVFTLLDRTPLAGMTTMQVNDLVEDYITRELQARPASKGQYDYPYVLNSSRNEVVCHGMPSNDQSPASIWDKGSLKNRFWAKSVPLASGNSSSGRSSGRWQTSS